MDEKNETNINEIVPNRIFAKQYPQSTEIEKSVLGALILEKDAILDVINILHEDTFYSFANKEVFKVIKTLYENHCPIDLRTVINQLEKQGSLEQVGGEKYIVSLIERVVSGANIEYHSFLILEYAIKREMISIANTITKQACNPTVDVFNLIDFSEKKLLEISSRNIKKNYSDIKTLLNETMENIKKRREVKDGITGIASGFVELDNITAGWQKNDLIIVAARPGMGKTAFVLSLIRNAAVEKKIPVVMFSLEMSSTQLISRLISAEAELEAIKISKGTLENYEWEQLKHQTKLISESPIFIDDTPALSIFELRTKCRKLKMQYDIQLIVIDYLQLLTSDTNKNTFNREQEISYISRSLKSLAKELEVPIITPSQLSRAVETRGGDKRPMLSDLRESGAIEQDADIVMFLYRPEYYGIFENDIENNIKGITEVIVAKHRNGPLGTAFIKFANKYVKFVDIKK